MKFTTALLAAMASLASGHMMMRSPIPMGSPDSAPLSPDGSNFPCKNNAANWNDKSKPNVMAVGESLKLQFTGGATHGGGSCQISITKDLNPTKNSKWMVIHSIEGGCPADAPGNLNADAASTATPGFDYKVPDHPDIPANNDYVMAWTWNNKIGNREFYMSCAYVQLKPAVKKRYEPTTPVKRDTSPLPDMFVSNLKGINDCVIDAGVDVLYPNPGKSVVRGSRGGSPTNLQPPNPELCGAAGARPADVSSATAVSVSAGNFATINTATLKFATVGAPSATAAAVTTPAATGPAATTPAVASIATVSPIAPSPAASAVATSAAAPASQPSASTGGSTAAGPQSGPCTNEGAWACASDGKSFQRCASGAWSAAIPMAAGTKCTPGVSNTFSMVAAGAAGKRDMRSHILRRRYEQFSG